MLPATTATNPGKLWKTSPQKARNAPLEMICDCKCRHCQSIYKSYLEEKAERQLSDSLLNEERQETKSLIDKIEALEIENQRLVDELTADVEKEQATVKELRDQLEEERRLRMQELYMRESEINQKTAQEKEVRILTEQVMKYSASLRSISHENQALTAQLKMFDQRTNHLDQQLMNYEAELTQLDYTNSVLRTRLDKSGQEMDRLRSGPKSSPSMVVHQGGRRHGSSKKRNSGGGGSAVGGGIGGRKGMPQDLRLPSIDGQY